MTWRAGLAALLVVVGTLPATQAEDTTLPPELAALAGTQAQRAEAQAALDDLRAALQQRDRLAQRRARTRLRLAGDAGVARGARALLELPDGDDLLPEVALALGPASPPAFDLVWAHVARRSSPILRALAAQGLAHERTAAGVETLGALARDPLPGVRGAAWRALFAREDAPALRARVLLPADEDADLEALRLRLHRLRGDAGSDLLRHAQEAWAAGSRPAVRLAAGRVLACPQVGAPTSWLLALVAETGRGSAVAQAQRLLAGLPTQGYDVVAERWVAMEAALTALERDDLGAERRDELLDRCVEWLAHPVPMDPNLPDPIPERVLRRRLPDMGAALLPALERRLRPGGFAAPREGTSLLAELPAAHALPVLMRLLAPEQPQPLRAAASGALWRLGTLGEEALARRLTDAREDASIRRDAIAALGREPAAWAVAVLTELLALPTASSDAAGVALPAPERRSRLETIESAADALEQRTEPEARQALAAFVLDGRCPEHRLAARLSALFVPWDADALSTLEAALAAPRAALRSTALSLVARFPLPRLTSLLPHLRAFQPRLRGAAEVEAWVPAMLRAAPSEGLAWIRDHWEDAPVGASLPSTRCRMLSALDHVRQREHLDRVVNLALEMAGSSADPQLLQHAADGLSGRRGARDEELDTFFRRLLLGQGVEGGDDTRAEVAAATVRALESPGRGDLTGPLMDLIERVARDPDQSHRAVAALRVLVHQPWDRVERRVLELALDGGLEGQVRTGALRLLAGRASAAARTSVLERLVDARSGEIDAGVLLGLAAAAGTGAGAPDSERMRRALEEELSTFYADPARLDPFVERLDVLPLRVQALAAGVAYAGQAPELDRLARWLVEPRFAAWTHRVLAHAEPRPASAGALGALVAPTQRTVLLLEDARSGVSALVPEVATLTLGLKALGDVALAESLSRVLATAAVDRNLSGFADAWFYKLASLLHEPRSRDHVRSAAVVEQWIDRLEPDDGPFDEALALQRAERAARGGHLEAAADAYDAQRRQLARRGADLSPVTEGQWLAARSRARACRALARAARVAEAPVGRAEFAAVVVEVQHDPEALSALAGWAAGAGLELDVAERLAERALALERRAESDEPLHSVAALGQVLLARGATAQAAARLEQALANERRPAHGRWHLLLARAHAQAGDLAAAARALRQAILAEPSLEDGARTDPLLQPLAADGLLERTLEQARAALAAGSED